MILVGDESVAKRYSPIEPITEDVLENYAKKLRESGAVPDIELRYGDLMRSIRRASLDPPP